MIICYEDTSVQSQLLRDITTLKISLLRFIVPIWLYVSMPKKYGVGLTI